MFCFGLKTGIKRKGWAFIVKIANVWERKDSFFC